MRALGLYHHHDCSPHSLPYMSSYFVSFCKRSSMSPQFVTPLGCEWGGGRRKEWKLNSFPSFIIVVQIECTIRTHLQKHSRRYYAHTHKKHTTHISSSHSRYLLLVVGCWFYLFISYGGTYLNPFYK